ncbi:uncharacterized protein LOC132637688 [Lycium barbarum]|uniref:uncharacterized protein LOC132637688 n=1 Tax=Lycium barbarum TaxID=112863 RepID=UPI00293EE9C3|nr:uncharacterized protein LOC132637688 [Lycium barbarum]
MAAECRFTIVGRFLKPRPQIDRLRSSFKELITLRTTAKIGVFDTFNVFIDFYNEEDFNSVWFRRVIDIEGQQMWLQKWSPDFKPEEDLLVAPVWVLLPTLPFHLHHWHYMKQIVSNIGTPLELDMATKSRTRPSMAKIRVEIDLLKTLPDKIWIGMEYENAPLKGFYQKVEYEGIPKYCKHCRKLGHVLANCRILERKQATQTKNEDANVGSNIGGKHANRDENVNKVQPVTQNSNNSTNTVSNHNEGDQQRDKNNKGEEEQGALAAVSVAKPGKKKKIDKKSMPTRKPSVLLKIIQSTKKKNKKRKARKIQERGLLSKEQDEVGNSKSHFITDAKDTAVDQVPCLNDGRTSDQSTQLEGESARVPPDIRNLPAINLIVDLDVGPIFNDVTEEDAHQDPRTNGNNKKDLQQEELQQIHSQQRIDVTSPSRVVVTIPEDQLQIVAIAKDNNDSFSPVVKSNSKQRKNNKKNKGVKSKKAIQRLKKLIYINKVDLTVIMEPFVSMNKINRYMKYLGYQHCISNPNGKLWIFWNGDHQTVVVDSTDQQITIKKFYIPLNCDLFITAVYAKCTPSERQDLWADLINVHNKIQGPWCIGGDFNVILDPDEKLGGKPHRMGNNFDFSTCMDSYGVTDLGFVGPKFTWCNNRKPRARIWKRLDRMFINDKWAQIFQHNRVKHLVRTGSDHRPLLTTCHNDSEGGTKYFKFLDFWADQPTFTQILQQSWNTNIIGNPMWRLQSKLKILSKNLSTWSKEVVGNVYDQVKDWEDKLHHLEEQDINQNSDLSREELNKGQAEYTRWMGLQESLLKQKSLVDWFEEGDCNTRYFHSVIRERRRKLHIHTIKDHHDNWTQGDDNIANAAVRHFKHLFNIPHQYKDTNITDCIPKIVTAEDNKILTSIPDIEEIKTAVFSLSASSSPGPDGYNGTFYQKCWNIISNDVKDFVQSFFQGKKLTKLYSHTCLVLIPKITPPSCFSDLRPISLTNFSCKIISKILSNRLSPMLDKIISENQSGFVKGRLITENILLAQEIVHDIKKYNKGGNMVIKLDMAKAYDRMSWDFLITVMKKFGFSDKWLMFVGNLLAGVWYSIIINGNRNGFFTSTHGLKQGDPLSPSLFIIGAEVLSRSLNRLNQNSNFSPFTMDTRGPIINHLAYADDIVIFCGGNNKSIKLIKHQIQRYERASGYKINDNKSFFLTAPNTSAFRINRMRRMSGYMDKSFPFTYLGSPIYCGRKTYSLFNGMLANIVKRLNGWQSGMLSFGGKVVLIKHVLQSLPVYIMSAMNPPKGVITLMEKHFANFLWGTTEGKNKYHWASWENLCLPKDEGGIEVAQDIAQVDIGDREEPDFPVWQPTEDGIVSNKSAWMPTYETIQHFFAESEAGRHLWNFFGNPLGIRHTIQPMVGIFNRWWNTNNSNIVHKLLLQITPAIICWELWKQRRSCKYGNQRQILMGRMQYQGIWTIKAALSNLYPPIKDINHWPTICSIVERLKPIRKWWQVMWENPMPGNIKVNTDGSYLIDSGKAGIGGIVRNSQGELIMAFSKSVQSSINNSAEALAAEFGVKWCYHQGYTNFTLELDSMVIANMINKQDSSNAKLKQTVNNLLRLQRQTNFQVKHCFREGNQVADSLAKLASASDQN